MFALAIVLRDWSPPLTIETKTPILRCTRALKIDEGPKAIGAGQMLGKRVGVTDIGQLGTWVLEIAVAFWGTLLRRLRANCAATRVTRSTSMVVYNSSSEASVEKVER